MPAIFTGYFSIGSPAHTLLIILQPADDSAEAHLAVFDLAGEQRKDLPARARDSAACV